MPRRDGVDVHLDDEGNPRMITRKFAVDETHEGLRLDQFLVRKIPRMSRTKLQKLMRGQVTRAAGRSVRGHAKVEVGETIVLTLKARPEPPCPRYFEELYSDEDLLVVDKPPGLPVHATAKFYFNTLSRVLLETFGEPPPQICHRLDRETSGCLIVARSASVAALVKMAFADKTIHKTYLAIVYGDPPWDEETDIDLPLGQVGPEHPISHRMAVTKGGLPSVTRVQVLSRP